MRLEVRGRRISRVVEGVKLGEVKKLRRSRGRGGRGFELGGALLLEL